jgi:hypothetical protein
VPWILFDWICFLWISNFAKKVYLTRMSSDCNECFEFLSIFVQTMRFNFVMTVLNFICIRNIWGSAFVFLSDSMVQFSLKKFYQSLHFLLFKVFDYGLIIVRFWYSFVEVSPVIGCLIKFLLLLLLQLLTWKYPILWFSFSFS